MLFNTANIYNSSGYHRTSKNKPVIPLQLDTLNDQYKSLVHLVVDNLLEDEQEDQQPLPGDVQEEDLGLSNWRVFSFVSEKIPS